MKELLKITFEYNWKPTPEQVARLSELSGKEIELQDDGTLNWTFYDYQLTLEEAFSICNNFTIKGRTRYGRIEDLEKELSEFVPNSNPAPVNQRCNVIVAGTSVIEMNSVHLLADACTDTLQSELNLGWRILAICVQPDQRRPDYILGRKD